MALKTFERVAAERRKQREKDDTLWQTVAEFLDRPEDSNYLGDPEVLEALVRSKLARVIKARMEAAEAAARGETIPDAGAVAHREAAEFAEIVLGANRSYEVLSPYWNSPTGGVMGQIRRRYNLQAGDPAEIAAFPLWAAVRAYLDAVNEENAGREWEHLIDGEIEIAVAVLLGVDDIMFPFEL